MKELFTGFLSVSLAGSLVLCAIMLLRIVFKKAPKALTCVLWLIAFIRLLLPFQIPAPWSLRPFTPVISPDETQLFLDSETVVSGELPEFIPQAFISRTGQVVDFVGIAAIVWTIGVVAVLGYLLVSYILLRRRMRSAVRMEQNVYMVKGLQSAFLLGYLSPKIYLPAELERQSADLVIAHELMHKKRGDHWLKLIGFVCLAFHWFNPLVWLSYVLLCRDVEDACDEQVIKNLGTQERKAYSTALLACGKPEKKSRVYSVAFGEISIGQRIKNVLNYRKPAAWISLIAVLAIVFVSFFFLTDPIRRDVVPPYYEELVSLIGKPVDEVCTGLGITREQLGEDIFRGVYETSLPVEYMGAEFQLVLLFNNSNGPLDSFRYVARYDGISEEAAADAEVISRQLWKNYGKGYQWQEKDEPKRLADITAEEILAIYNTVNERHGSYAMREDWDLTQDAPKNVQTYLDQLELSENWQQLYGEKAKRYGVSPHYFLEFSTGVEGDGSSSYIILAYKTGWQPGHYWVEVTADRNK